MTRPRPLAPLLAGLMLQSGCGLLLGGPVEPIVRGKLPDPGPDETKSFAFSGEIRDHATFRPEPDARIEFWSDDPDYAPSVKLDGRGAFSVRVDACKQSTSAAEHAVAAILVPNPSTCSKWIGRFEIRARLGDRCSLPIGDRPLERGPLVLWLTDCPEPRSGAKRWRPAPAGDDPRSESAVPAGPRRVLAAAGSASPPRR